MNESGLTPRVCVGMTETAHTVELERAATLSTIRCAANAMPRPLRPFLLAVASTIEAGEHLQHHREHQERDALADRAKSLLAKAKAADLPVSAMKQAIGPLFLDVLTGDAGTDTLQGFCDRLENLLTEHLLAKSAGAPAPEAAPAG